MLAQKKAEQTDSQIKTEDAILPGRNIMAEIFIQVGALAILAYAIMLVLYSFALYGLMTAAFNDAGSAMVGPIALLILLFCINLTVQAVKLLRESNRIDHYGHRIIAICLILLLPIVLTIPQIFVCIAASTGLGIIGSIWLWVLLTGKNKMVWTQKASNANSYEDEQTVESLAKNQRLGRIFLCAPVVAFALLMFIPIFIGGIGNAGMPFQFVLLSLQRLLSLLWLPSVIVGIVFLARSK